jgi:hypothetical protein
VSDQIVFQEPNELDEIRHLLEEFAMSIYPHGKTPVWNSVSDGVKDLIDYAKSLDDTDHRQLNYGKPD